MESISKDPTAMTTRGGGKGITGESIHLWRLKLFTVVCVKGIRDPMTTEGRAKGVITGEQNICES